MKSFLFEHTSVDEIRLQNKVHYTITPIGGNEELKKWKAERVEHEARCKIDNKQKINVRRDALVEKIASELDIYPIIADEDKLEMATLNRKRRLALSKEVLEKVLMPQTEVIKVSLKEKLKQFSLSLINSLFDK